MPTGDDDLRLTELSRRGLGALAGAGLLAAGLGRPARAQAPQKGGLLRVATHSQSTNDTFNSAKFVYGNDYMRGASFYSYLTSTGPDGQAQPELAESWEGNAEATRWRFKIRRGVTFHDGSPLTLQDVIFSIMRHKLDRTASSARPLVANIQSMTADGDDAVVVQLERADVEMPILIGTFQLAIVKDGTEDFSRPNGTGAFVLQDFTPGVRTAGKRNPNFWKEGRPYVDGFEQFTVLDHTARMNALLSGDAHIISEVRGPAIDAVSKSDNAAVFVTPAPRYTTIQSVASRMPNMTLDLRLALAHLVDRQRYLDVVLKGHGVLANDHPIMPANPMFNRDLPQRGLDLDKAKFHFGKTGFGRTPVELHVSVGAPFSVEIAQLMQREASRIGMTIDVKMEPADSYWNKIETQWPIFANTHNPRPTPGIMLNLFYMTTAPWNFPRTGGPDLDEAIATARSSPSLEQRTQAYHKVQSIIHADAANVIPAFMSTVDGHAKKVKGLVPIPLGNLSGWNFTDRVWFEA